MSHATQLARFKGLHVVYVPILEQCVLVAEWERRGGGGGKGSRRREVTAVTGPLRLGIALTLTKAFFFALAVLVS